MVKAHKSLPNEFLNPEYECVLTAGVYFNVCMCLWVNVCVCVCVCVFAVGVCAEMP